MALQIRRGTDAERLTITPAEGELIYTTDSKLLYVGDGTTVGGVKSDSGINDLIEDTTPQLGGPLDLNSQNITGVGNINTSGNITATGVVSAASGSFTAATIGLATGNFKGSFAADDSTILIDGISGKVNLAPNEIDDLGNVVAPSPADGEALVWNSSLARWEAGAPASTGDVIGSVFADDSTLKIDGLTGISYGPFVGDLNGSVFGDDSSVLVDGINNIINGDLITANISGTISNSATGDFFYNVDTEDGKVNLRLKRTSSSDLSSSNVSYGSILMGREGSDGTVMTTNIATSFTGLYISNDSDGSHDDASTYLCNVNGNIGIGTFTPSSKLDVAGEVVANSFKGTLTADDSTIIIDGVNQSANVSTVTASGYMQFGGYTTTERDNLTAVNGMVIYNTSLNKFQGYENGGWVNLV